MNKQIVFTLFFGIAVIGCQSEPETAPPIAQSAEATTLATNIDVATAYSLYGNEDVVWIDIREDSEYSEIHIPNTIHIPMGEISSRLDEIPADKTVLISCHSGGRSDLTVNDLRSQGFDNVHNVDGGIMAWKKAGYAVVE